MLHSSVSLVIAVAAFASCASAQADLVGTWTTKSRQVLTGPGFYDPVNEKMFEPNHTGISYSFTDDGHYEEAYYQAVSNPTQPQCPRGMIQWQHGTFVKNVNGSLSLSPFGVDGRQLQSDPCHEKQSIYTRYNQPEMFERYEVYTDPYHNVPRLNLYKFDGSPMSPMYLAYSPPQMLPTQTLNPTASGTPKPTVMAGIKSKRAYEDFNAFTEPSSAKVMARNRDPVDVDKWWWIGAGMTAMGGVIYFYF